MEEPETVWQSVDGWLAMHANGAGPNKASPRAPASQHCNAAAGRHATGPKDPGQGFLAPPLARRLGSHSYGLGEHPYSGALLDRLAAVLPDGSHDIQVLADGMPGGVVARPTFRRRLQMQLEARSFDWVILLGGTNDLAFSANPKVVFDALKTCWDMALASGSKVLALTVPECAARSESLDAVRRALNASILHHEQANFYALDLFAKIPYHSLAERDRDAYWDDGLHLTADGYDWMGRHVADGLLAILDQQRGAEAGKLTNRKRRTRSGGGGQPLDEEAGSPDVISQGYVVVRRKDLD